MRAVQLEKQVEDLLSKDRALTFHKKLAVSGKGKTAGQLFAVMTPLGAEYCYLAWRQDHYQIPEPLFFVQSVNLRVPMMARRSLASGKHITNVKSRLDWWGSGCFQHSLNFLGWQKGIGRKLSDQASLQM